MTKGTPQGAVVSPLLANIHLHYMYDLWTEQWRRRHAHGTMIVVRYADDTVVGFEHRADAERFLAGLRIRMAEFDLEPHPNKTRLIEFGRGAASDRTRRGDGKPETFNLLGFTHICSRSRRGGFLLSRHTRRDRKRAKLLEISEDLRRRAPRGHGQTDRTVWTDWRISGCPNPGYPIPGLQCASASNTQGGSRMRECRPYGSVRGGA